MLIGISLARGNLKYRPWAVVRCVLGALLYGGMSVANGQAIEAGFTVAFTGGLLSAAGHAWQGPHDRGGRRGRPAHRADVCRAAGGRGRGLEPRGAMALLIYGANGYTGTLIARRAAARGVPAILGGRQATP